MNPGEGLELPPRYFRQPLNEASWVKRYTAGVMLLDLDDSSEIVGLYKEPLIRPEAPHKVDGGFRNNMVLPCGIVLEESGGVKIHYGAANVDDLIRLCLDSPRG